jgi:tetratricopeptide (TPR) repeat protein
MRRRQGIGPGLLLALWAIWPCFAAGQVPPSEEQVSDEIQQALASGGIPKAVDIVRRFSESYPNSLQSVLTPVLKIAAAEFQKGHRRAAIDLLEASKSFFPKLAGIYAVLGQFYWYEKNREACVRNFQKTLEISPDNKTAREYMDLLFFVPEDFQVPQLLLTKRMRVRPLRAADVDLDYRAVMGSRDHIRGVFGPGDDWPRDDLSYEDDLRALKNHEDEFRRRTAFTFTVTDHREKECLGCVYILPIHAAGYKAQVFLWVTAEAFRKGYDQELFSAVKAWLTDYWPFSRVAFPGREMDWDTYDRIQRSTCLGIQSRASMNPPTSSMIALVFRQASAPNCPGK